MRPTFPSAILAIALLAVLAVAAGSAAADRPRLRPTPDIQAPPASSVPASGAPDASVLPGPSASLPAAAGCLGLERPTAPASPGPSSSPPAGTPAAAPTETTVSERVVVPVVDHRLDLPADWVALQDEDLASLEDVPSLTATLEAIEASSLVLLAADVLPGETCDLGGTLSLYDLGAALDPGLLALSAEAIALGLEELDDVQGEVKVAQVDLPVGETQRLTFRIDATEDGAVTAWWVRADAFVASGRTLLAAYAAPQELAEDAKPAFTAIAKSIRER